MVRQLLILACLLGLNLSVVVCREDHDHRPHFSDFMSHHHRRSTPGEIIPSTEVPVELVSGGPTPKPAVAVKTGGEHVGEPQHGYWDDDDDDDDWNNNWSRWDRETNDQINTAYRVGVGAQIASIIIGIGGVVFGLIIIFCCGKKCGRKVLTGRVVNAAQGYSAGVQPPTYATSQQHAYSPQTVEMQKVPLS